MIYAIVNQMIAPVMSKPNHLSERIDEVLYGMRITILEQVDDNWYYIKTHYHYEGYIEKCQLYEHEYRIENWEKVTKLVVLPSFADILLEPLIKSQVLMTLTRGSIVALAKDSDCNGFVKINLWDGTYGYVKENFLIKYTTENMSEEQLRQQIVYSALSYTGTQYRWGGRSPIGIDCSGLCQMAYMLNGIIIYRDAKIREEFPVKEIEKKNMKLADLLYFPGHIAMYIGDESYIHATAKNGSDGVVINSLNPKAMNFRKDLADSLYAVGSVFKQ